MMKFEKLEVWQKAVDFTFDIHQLTRKLPKEEMYILTAQIKRAADSVALNIAEGSTGQTNAVFKQFISYAVRSGIEVVTCLHIGRRRGIITDVDFYKMLNRSETILKMLCGLRNSIR